MKLSFPSAWLRTSLFLALAVFVALPAFASGQATTAPQEQQATPEDKLSLYVFSKVSEGDAVGQSFVDAFNKALPTDDLNVTQGQPEVDAPNVTNFRLFTMKSDDKTSFILLVIVRHTKGFDKSIYVASAMFPVTSDEVAKGAATDVVESLEQIFVAVELLGEYDQQSTPVPQQ